MKSSCCTTTSHSCFLRTLPLIILYRAVYFDSDRNTKVEEGFDDIGALWIHVSYWIRVEKAAMAAMIAAVPVLVALDPATVSNQCARLEDDINAICGQDLTFARGFNFLRHLQSLNKQQGLGLVVFGVVCSKRTFGVAASGTYGLLVLLWSVVVLDWEQQYTQLSNMTAEGCTCP